MSPPFQGTFNSWFTDGANFFTSTGNVYWIYSSAGVQQEITQQIAIQGGRGAWFWTFAGGTISIYQVGASTSPALTTSPINPEYSPQIVSSGPTLGFLAAGWNQLVVIDLSGATPVSSTYTLPALMDFPSSFAAASASSWIVGNRYGLVLDGASLSGQPHFFTLGQVTSIAAGTAYFAVATASGQILYFDATTNATLGTIDFPSSQLSMSADGKIPLAAARRRRSVTTSLPAGALIGSALPAEISLAGSGLGCGGEVISLTSLVMGSQPARTISPDGTFVAVASGGNFPTTTIYTNGVTTAVTGAVGWLDNTRLGGVRMLVSPSSRHSRGCCCSR